MMKLSRRIALKWIVAAIALGVGTQAASAADSNFPARPVRIVVPFPPGGSTDIIARFVAHKLTEKHGQQFFVDNRPGANGGIGSAQVANSPADGYTLLFGTTATLAVNPHLYPAIGYSPARDFAAVTSVVLFTMTMVVHPSVPAKSVKELIELAKAKPGTLNFGSAGNGNGTHLAGELFKQMAGVDMVHVPFKGGAPALAALTAGDVQVLFNNAPETLPAIRHGRVRVLAVTTKTRLGTLPEVPTLHEAGVPGYELYGSGGIVAPSGTPTDVIERLNASINEVLRAPDTVERLRSMELLVTGGSSAAYAEHIRSELKKWGNWVRTSGAKVE